jgi:hypothetical protein
MSGAFLEQGRQKHRERSYKEEIAKRSIVEATRPRVGTRTQTPQLSPEIKYRQGKDFIP